MEHDHNNRPEQEEPVSTPAEPQRTDDTPEEMSVIARRLAMQRRTESNTPAEDKPADGSEDGPSDKSEAASLTDTSPTLRWLDNFWYHHKWKVIIAVFFVAVGIIGGIQLFNRPNYDSSICIISTYRMDKNERAAFEQLMESICPADFNGDGKTMVNIVDYQFYSEAEYEAEVDRYGAITNEEGQTESFRINKDYNLKEFDGFIKYSMTGETSVCLVSSYVYEKLKEADRLKPLAEIYGEEAVPETAVDAYGIRFMQTDFYRYHPEVKMLPDNLILCVLRPSTITGRNKNETVYAHDLAFFRAIADFTVSEDAAT